MDANMVWRIVAKAVGLMALCLLAYFLFREEAQAFGVLTSFLSAR